MKAFIIEKPGVLRETDLPKPAPGPRDVVSRVVYSGVCGTDIGLLTGGVSFAKDGTAKYPISVGHEWSGVVESVGSKVTRFKPGDRVVSDNGVSCGECSVCLAGDIYRCPHGRSLGTVNAWHYGSFAEYILMPERHMFHLDGSVSFEQGALIEPATIAYAAAEALDIGKGDTVLVTGTGAVGMSAAALAKIFGADKVVIAGRSEKKLGIGLKIGADAAVNTSENKMPAAFFNASGEKKASKIIEASGSADALDRALDCAAFKCRVAMLGFYEGKINDSFVLDRIVLNNLTLTGITGAPRVPQVMSLMASGRLNLEPLVTHIFPAKKTAEAFAAAQNNFDGKIKILVKMTDG